VTRLLEDLRSHVAWCTASSREYVELLLIHDPT
jgi:hypothetical protein